MEYVGCVYCGGTDGIEREHVIPASFLGFKSFDKREQWLVEACKMCNGLAGSNVFFSIPEKAAFLRDRYKRRFRSLLKVGLWREEELKELSYKLRVAIEGKQVAQSLLRKKVGHLELVMSFPKEYLRPKWIEVVEDEWKKRRTKQLNWEKKHWRENYGATLRAEYRNPVSKGQLV